MTIKFKKLSLEMVLHICLAAFALTSLYPLVWMIFNSLKNNDEIFFSNIFGIPTKLHFENYIHAVTQFDILLFFRNSVVIAVCTIILSLILSLMFSYAVARMTWKLSNTVRIYATLGMFIPVQIIIIPLVFIVKDLHLQHSLLSIIMPYVAFNLSFTSIVFYAFFRSIPFEMEESAALDGASIYIAFARILLPLVTPAIATTTIFIFLNSWNELFIALVMINDKAMNTLPLGLIYFQGRFSTDWGASAAAMTIASVPPVVLYLFFSEQVERALTVGSSVK